MEATELEAQSRRVEQGRKLSDEIKRLEKQYSDIQSASTLVLYSNRNGCISHVHYGSMSALSGGTEFDLFDQKQINSVMDLVRDEMLKSLQAKIDGVKSKFAKV